MFDITPKGLKVVGEGAVNFYISKNNNPSTTTLGTMYTNRLYVPSEKNV